MKSKLLYQGLSLLAAAAALIGASDTALAQQTGQKPNFVHIVADDLAWKDVGFNGCTQDPSEKNNLAAANPDKVAAFQQRLDALAKESVKPLFLVDQFKVVMKNMNGELVMPTDEEFDEADNP